MRQKLLTALISTVLLVTACKEKGRSQAKAPTVTNQELKVGITQEFENLNMIIAQMLATSHMYKIVGRNLTTMTPEGEWIPQIVEELPSLENGKAKFTQYKGKKTIQAEWRIRDDQFWGDGTPVTAADVEFSWRVGMHDNVSVGEREVYDQVVKVIIDSKDPKKFTFIYNKPRWDFSHLGTFYILPKHLEEPVFNKYAKQPLGYEKNTLYVANPTNPGLYNGPYVVSEMKLGSHIIFTPNPHWKGKKPHIQKLTYKLIPNTSTLEANLRSGTIDMISIIGLKFDQAIKFAKVVDEEGLPVRVNFKPSTTYEHIDLQVAKNPILKDVRVRKALVYSINREDLVKALFDGKQQTALHNITPICPWFTDDPNEIVVYQYSPRKARKLLDEAGWKPGKDGFRYKNGEKLKFQFMTTAGDKSRELVQTYLQDQWKKVGIEISIKNEPARVYFGETVRKGKYTGLAMFAWISSPESTPKSTLSSKNIPTQKNGFKGQNSGGWSNPEVDSLLEKVDSEFSFEKRKKLIQKALYHYTNEVPVIPLYYRSNISVTPKNLTGYRVTPHQFASTNHVEEWNLSEEGVIR